MIKEYRKKHNYTQKDLAEIINCNVSSISRAERGMDLPRIRREVRRLVALDTALSKYQYAQNLQPERITVTSYRTKKSFLGRIIDGLKRIF